MSAFPVGNPEPFRLGTVVHRSAEAGPVLVPFGTVKSCV
jgi:hypothetical protein